MQVWSWFLQYARVRKMQGKPLGKEDGEQDPEGANKYESLGEEIKVHADAYFLLY